MTLENLKVHAAVKSMTILWKDELKKFHLHCYRTSSLFWILYCLCYFTSNMFWLLVYKRFLKLLLSLHLYFDCYCSLLILTLTNDTFDCYQANYIFDYYHKNYLVWLLHKLYLSLDFMQRISLACYQTPDISKKQTLYEQDVITTYDY